LESAKTYWSPSAAGEGVAHGTSNVVPIVPDVDHPETPFWNEFATLNSGASNPPFTSGTGVTASGRRSSRASKRSCLGARDFRLLERLRAAIA
jgi:hypothetical protein